MAAGKSEVSEPAKAMAISTACQRQGFRDATGGCAAWDSALAAEAGPPLVQTSVLLR